MDINVMDQHVELSEMRSVYTCFKLYRKGGYLTQDEDVARKYECVCKGLGLAIKAIVCSK